MNDTQFACLMQRLTREGSRRHILGSIAGAAMVLAGAGVLEAKNSKGKGKAKGKGQGQGQGKGQGSTSAPGKQPKVGVCHFDEESGLYTYLELPPPAAKAHEKHGDPSLTEDECLKKNDPPSDSPEE